MASMPGILTEWPWKPLGSFKYVVLAPWVVHSIYSFCVKEKSERCLLTFLIFPFLLWRMLHNQIWITLSRYRTAKGATRIVDKGLEFDQVDRERNWDDQILLNGILFYLVSYIVAEVSDLPWWRTDGVVTTVLLHAGPVEFLYYWLHRALHHHCLYSRYHSHHHSSIVTEPITSVIHPFAEHIAYFALFAIPLMTVVLVTKTGSIGGVFGYITYIDFMNNMGHCNLELIPKWLFNIFPPLKYLTYTPSFHSLHHTKFRTNYSLFMPFYDYIYGTMDKSSDQLHEFTLNRKEEFPDVVHLTHLTTPDSIYHLRFGLASLASKPHSSIWYLQLMWPSTLCSLMLTWVSHGGAFILDTNRFKKLIMQTWALPKYNVQYSMQGQKEPINTLIEEAIMDAERKGAKVLSLGLMNQGEELNTYGALYVSKYPKLKVKVVDGSSLAVAVVLNSVPKETTQVLLRGKLTKGACAIASALCQKDIQVATMHQDECEKLKKLVEGESRNNLIISTSYSQQIWLVGEEFTKKEQLKAPKGTSFIPYSQFPPKKYRKDCFYQYTPAMLAPESLENMHSCENWLPRRVMSAWRIAGIVHSLEGWNEHECGNITLNIDKVWQATLFHGFQPLPLPND